MMQVGELAGIAVGATVMLNILVAGYVRSLLTLSWTTSNISQKSTNPTKHRSFGPVALTEC